MPDGSHNADIALHRAHYDRGVKVYPQVTCMPLVAQTTMKSAFAMRTPAMLALEGRPETERLAAYRDPAWRAKNALELSQVRFPVAWSCWQLSLSPTAPQLVGKNLDQVASARGTSPLDAVFDLSLEDKLATRFTVLQCNFQEDDVAALLNLDGARVGLGDAGAHPEQLCDAVVPTMLLGKWVREKRVLPLEKAIRKLTGEIADLVGLDRGYLRVGAPADITVFDPDKIASGPTRRVNDQPAGGERVIADQTEGLLHVLVNGLPVRRDGEHMTRGPHGDPGLVLRG
jgi:N-acyl-D-aspartate/D-glutamate deacylase